MLIAFVVFSLVVFFVGLYALTRVVIPAQQAHEGEVERARRVRRRLLTARIAEQEAARIERERKHPPIKNFARRWIREYFDQPLEYPTLKQRQKRNKQCRSLIRRLKSESRTA